MPLKARPVVGHRLETNQRGPTLKKVFTFPNPGIDVPKKYDIINI